MFLQYTSKSTYISGGCWWKERGPQVTLVYGYHVIVSGWPNKLKIIPLFPLYLCPTNLKAHSCQETVILTNNLFVLCGFYRTQHLLKVSCDFRLVASSGLRRHCSVLIKWTSLQQGLPTEQSQRQFSPLFRFGLVLIQRRMIFHTCGTNSLLFFVPRGKSVTQVVDFSWFEHGTPRRFPRDSRAFHVMIILSGIT